MKQLKQGVATADSTKHQWYRHVIAKRLALVLGIVIIASIVFFLIAQRPIMVEVAHPETNVPITVFGLGTVEARVLSEVSFEVRATLIELNADHGDHVSKNEVLARLHNAEQAAHAAKAKAGVANAKASLHMTQAMVEKARAVLAQRQQTNHRQQSLLTRNTVSKEAAEVAQLQEEVAAAELVVAKSEVEVAIAKLADARAQLDYENVLLGHHTLRSPYDAIVVKRHHELGSVLNAGESLFTLVDATTLWVLAYVDESRAGHIRVGQPAEVRLRSLPRMVFTAHVVRIDIESDRVNEERRIYVACDQCPETFHLGEQAEVFITTMNLKEATLIPETAVAEFDGMGGRIWVVNKQRLQSQVVQFGSKTLDGHLEITGGLADGVLPVTTLRNGLREGRRARKTP
ncbi:MAG: efflux RND transporter periplasmic adaptor subunit [Proteobacteria bacterium]|nr:efflux RND transporter periplasmic adaptor subunit [Pseudomonadota bacterium]NOG59846.1 efflux RND transporter periplasmic adaptor subunit [Pseudomonadota bacterium]